MIDSLVYLSRLSCWADIGHFGQHRHPFQTCRVSLFCTGENAASVESEHIGANEKWRVAALGAYSRKRVK